MASIFCNYLWIVSHRVCQFSVFWRAAMSPSLGNLLELTQPKRTESESAFIRYIKFKQHVFGNSLDWIICETLENYGCQISIVDLLNQNNWSCMQRALKKKKKNSQVKFVCASNISSNSGKKTTIVNGNMLSARIVINRYSVQVVQIFFF